MGMNVEILRAGALQKIGLVSQSMYNTSLQIGDLPMGKTTRMQEQIANCDPFGSYVFQLSTSTSISQWVKW